MFILDEIGENIRKDLELYESTTWTIMHYLIGVVTKKLRGITLNFDGKWLTVEVFLDNKPTDREIEDWDDIETYTLGSFPPDKDYRGDLFLIVVDPKIDIRDRRKNWGWIFLHREE